MVHYNTRSVALLALSTFLYFSSIFDQARCHVTHKRSSVSHLVHNKNRFTSIFGDEETNDIKTIGGGKLVKHKDVCLDGFCVPSVQCPAHVRNTTVLGCKTLTGRTGVCCTTGQNHTSPTDEKFRGRNDITLDSRTVGAVARHSRAEVAELRAREARLLYAGHASILFPGSASYSHSRNSRMFNMADLSEVMDVASRAMEIALATRAFKDRQGVTNQQLELGMVKGDLRHTPLGNACSSRPFCSQAPEKYRRIDGACNNRDYPWWGSPLTPYARLLPPTYHDGVWMPRVSEVNGQPLTSPRKISTTVLSDRDSPNYDYTLLVMQFGQFISHDITQSIDITFSNGSGISCCSKDGGAELHTQDRHYACLPIDIPEDDPFYGRFKQRCMNFVRSVLAPRQDCTLGYANQMNKITHFIDGSSVYGSTPEQTGELRSFEAGKLAVFHDFGRDLLPLSKDKDACLTMEEGSACFTSGDTRTNQMISLVLLHTIFHREHNRLATELYRLNPNWSDEKLFLEARQIVIATMQVVVYKEFLPAVIGEVAMEEFQLNLETEDVYSFNYDPTVEPSATNEFAAAALRFGHSIVDGLLRLYGTDRMEEMISIPEVMFQPSRLRKVPFLDELLSTLTTEPIQEVDNNLDETLTRYLFRGGNAFGIDLAALNIQRGRDHGLRPYNDYRQLVGLPKIASFEEFAPEISENLEKVYASVDDIDLWIGGLLEEKAPGSMVGYTFRDIIADQFYRLKHGDKYFFENDPSINPGYFTQDQLIELRKISMSRLICDNRDGVLLMRQAPNAFKQPGMIGNDMVDCTSSAIPRLNLEAWKE